MEKAISTSTSKNHNHQLQSAVGGFVAIVK